MKKTLFCTLSLCMCLILPAQNENKEHLTELAKAYKNYMFLNDGPKDLYKQLRSGTDENLRQATEFIIQTISTKNKLLSSTYLSRPDNRVLKQVYIIRELNLNLRKENATDNHTLIDSLQTAQVPVYEMLDNYYDMLFTSVGNKNKPFNLSKTNLALNSYGLKDDTEKGILVLQAMHLCGTLIWGYMNVVQPPNTQKAYDFIKKYPSINGAPYYQYTDFFFNDFEMVISTDKGPQSYKSFYLNKLYELLLSHLICLKREGGSKKETEHLLLSSILRENKLYKYTEYKELLEDIFQEVKKE